MSPESLPLHRTHSRQFDTNRFVYPVLSRRSKGISIGVNLNPDRICNFDCIYCQVDRRSESEVRFVEIEQLLAELREMLNFVSSGEIFDLPQFAAVPRHLQRLNDIAFSGDGEPTTFRNFDEIIAAVAGLKSAAGLGHVKMVLITNASMFHRPVVQQGLRILDENQGEIWAKLDAGTDTYYQLIERTRIPLVRILDNILEAARLRPLVIQSLFMNVHGVGPDTAEIEAYSGRLNEVIERGGELKLIQIYTVARQPAESYVAPLDDLDVDAIAQVVRRRTGLPVETYYSH